MCGKVCKGLYLYITFIKSHGAEETILLYKPDLKFLVIMVEEIDFSDNLSLKGIYSIPVDCETRFRIYLKQCWILIERA